MKKDITHVAVYTEDMEASIRFYTEVFHFQEKWSGKVELPHGTVEAALLITAGFYLELVKPVDLNSVSRCDGSVQHIAFGVMNLEEAIKECVEVHHLALSEEITQMEAFGGKYVHTFLRGPSNERIELICEIP